MDQCGTGKAFLTEVINLADLQAMSLTCMNDHPTMGKEFVYLRNSREAQVVKHHGMLERFMILNNSHLAGTSLEELSSRTV